MMKDKIMDKAKAAAVNMFNFPQVDSDLTAWFIFDKKEYEIAQFSIKFGQSVDYKGQPQNEVRGGIITVCLNQAVSESIYKWGMTSCLQNGLCEFRSKTSNSPLKIVFTDAYCVKLDRTVDISGGLNTILIISPREIDINEIDFDNNWV